MWTSYVRKDKLLYKSAKAIKTVYSNSSIKPTAVLINEYFDNMQLVFDIIKNNEISDSLVTIQDKKRPLKVMDAIEYYLHLGILKDPKVEQIQVSFYRIKGSYKKLIYRKSTKTKYTIDFSNAKDSILFDKEYNIYGINENGELIQKGRF